jgi:hypothetical protein
VLTPPATRCYSKLKAKLGMIRGNKEDMRGGTWSPNTTNFVELADSDAVAIAPELSATLVSKGSWIVQVNNEKAMLQNTERQAFNGRLRSG